MENPVAGDYRRFAELEAQGVSDIYFDWAIGVADDSEVLSLIAALPGMKKQANLVFAAARFHGAPVGPYPLFREWLFSHWSEVEPTIQKRATQTNEAGRCAVLLPALAQLKGPLALIEAGASAGLCLYPDRYSYRYDTGDAIIELDPPAGRSAVVIPCLLLTGAVPNKVPTVVWRAGVDLNPIDVRDDDAVAWLETLVWPEHDARRNRLHGAARIAADDPAHLIAGDIVDAIPDVISRAPRGSHVVVFHSAVLVYLAPDRREQFVELMRPHSEVTWISNEGASVLPSITQQVMVPIDGRTILAINGAPIALVGPHGQSYEAL